MTYLAKMDLYTPTPLEFNFKRTVVSHGWCELLPFELDKKQWSLLRILDIEGQQPITVRISAGKKHIVISTGRQYGRKTIEKIVRNVRHMLRLDDDMTSFYKAVATDELFGWIVREGAGRMLRSPTVFEDLVKSIATTNCSWALTDKMVTGLVLNLGRPATGGRHAFPTPEDMAQAPLEFYRDVVRAGYRAPYFKELAERVAAKEIDVEGWMLSELPTPELRREMKRVKGVGDYAAENLLKLIGRYDVLALDSWIRGKFQRSRANGRKCSDKKIARYYSRFKEWRGLALWCDMTRDWMQEEAE